LILLRVPEAAIKKVRTAPIESCASTLRRQTLEESANLAKYLLLV